MEVTVFHLFILTESVIASREFEYLLCHDIKINIVFVLTSTCHMEYHGTGIKCSMIFAGLSNSLDFQLYYVTSMSLRKSSLMRYSL